MGLVLCPICFADVVNIFSTLAPVRTVFLVLVFPVIANPRNLKKRKKKKKRAINASSASLVELSTFPKRNLSFVDLAVVVLEKNNNQYQSFNTEGFHRGQDRRGLVLWLLLSQLLLFSLQSAGLAMSLSRKSSISSSELVRTSSGNE